MAADPALAAPDAAIETTDTTTVDSDRAAENSDNEIQTTEIDFLDLPDDEVDAYFMKELEKTPEAEDSAGTDDPQSDEAAAAAADDPKADDDEDGEDDGEAAATENLDSGEAASDDDSDAGDDTASDDKASGDEAEAEEGDSAGDETEGQDDDIVTTALEDLEKILSPFKANGKDIQVENVDDAITLMKMGANYNKKMAALKPNLRFVKMLEQNDLLDEGKLTTLIDISKKNPSAIARFVKDNAIDTDEILAEDASENYSPGKYEVNDSEIELDQVLDGIRGNESFSRTIDVVSNQWDAKSKQIIFNDPNIITVIDSQIASGVFDKIVNRMETEKMLGKLNGVSDIVAYKQIGEALAAAGLLEPTQKGNGEQTQTTTTQAEKPVDKARNSKRKAAASTKQAVASKKKTDLDNLNPLSMSDDDFEKVAAQTLFK